MPKYLVQLTQEGRPEGTKVVDAAGFTTNHPSVIFHNADMVEIAAFNTFVVVVDIDSIPTIEADTAAFNAATA